MMFNKGYLSMYVFDSIKILARNGLVMIDSDKNEKLKKRKYMEREPNLPYLMLNLLQSDIYV